LSNIGISLIGLCLLAILTFKTSGNMINFPFKNILTGLLFMTVCIIGILAGISPSKCSRIVHSNNGNKKVNKKEKTNSRITTIKFKGHHPTCGKFSSHIIKLGNQTYCAGCIGLLTGAIISIFGSLLYFFIDFNIGKISILIFWLGFVEVACGLLQYHIIIVNSGVVHFFVNVIFVLGAFHLLIGVNEIKSNFVLNFFLLALIVYWIITRMLLSQLEHKEICSTCDLELCNG